MKYLIFCLFFVFPCFLTATETNVIEPHVLVIFGAKGDLALKKLYPALNELYTKEKLPHHFACLGVGRTAFTNNEFRHQVLNLPHSEEKTFADQVFYTQMDFKNDQDYARLKISLEELENSLQTKGNRIFYLSTSPSYFPIIIEKLKEHGLVYDAAKENSKWTRLILEKPLGNDYDSALKLRNFVVQNLHESQFYLIDHYLGKEVIQNLLTLRFLNPIFEHVWNSDHIESIQITLSEDIGIGDRGTLFEESGLLRDLVQNHIMQIVSLIAMEKPLTFSDEDIRAEKVQLLQAIQPFPLHHLDQHVIRGQYGPGIIHGDLVNGYREENKVNPNSIVETFVAAKLTIDTPRWKDVPFFILAGKRLKEKLTEIVIKFKQNEASQQQPNALIFRVQPDEEISLLFNSKTPDENIIQSAKMIFNYRSNFQDKIPDAYERLLYQCMQGDKRLFISFEESLISWALYTPVLDFWKNNKPDNFPNYPAGSEGPQDALNIFSHEVLK